MQLSVRLKVSTFAPSAQGFSGVFWFIIPLSYFRKNHVCPGAYFDLVVKKAGHKDWPQ